MAERERRRFEFGWLEVLGLVLIFAGGSAVVFFLGVFVGKGLQESRLQREERVVRLQVGPQSDKPEPAKDNDLPLYNEMAQGGPTPTPAVMLGVKKPPEGREAQATPPVELAEAQATPLPRLSPLPGRPAVQGMPAEDLTRSSIPPAAARPDAMRSGEGSWSVQVNATKDEAVADSLVKQLQGRGYNSYIVRVNLQGDTWYRVRVGKFPTMAAATAVVMRLKNEERYPRAFLVNE